MTDETIVRVLKSNVANGWSAAGALESMARDSRSIARAPESIARAAEWIDRDAPWNVRFGG